jgi:hypothetical protein
MKTGLPYSGATRYRRLGPLDFGSEMMNPAVRWLTRLSSSAYGTARPRKVLDQDFPEVWASFEAIQDPTRKLFAEAKCDSELLRGLDAGFATELGIRIANESAKLRTDQEVLESLAARMAAFIEIVGDVTAAGALRSMRAALDSDAYSMSVGALGFCDPSRVGVKVLALFEELARSEIDDIREAAQGAIDMLTLSKRTLARVSGL